MPIALKDLSLNSRLDKLEDELRVMLLFSSKEKNKCNDDHLSCDCLGAEEDSNHSQECKCIESPKRTEDPKISAKGFRSKSAPEKRRKKRCSSNSPSDQVSPKRELDKILELFKACNEDERKKKRHCICESSGSDCCKENKENKENFKPIDVRTPPRKSRTKKKQREKTKMKRLKSSSQTDSEILIKIPNDSIHETLCRPICSCDDSTGEVKYNCPNRAADLEIVVCNLRKELNAVSKSKFEADILKEKYDELQCCKMRFEIELQHLKKENQQLAENLRTEKNIRVTKVEEVQSEAKMLVNRIRSEEDKLVQDLESKNDLIRRLSQATDDLTRTIHEKEQENCAMNCKIMEIETTSKLASEKINLLKNTNKQLARSVLDKHHSLQNCKSKTCRFKREVKQYRTKVEQSLQEIKRLRDETHACECGKRSPRTRVNCQEMEDTNIVRELVGKISSLENIQLQNIAKMAKKNKALQSGFENLFQLMTCGDTGRKNTCCKCKEIKEKCQQFKVKCQELREEVKCLRCKEKQRDCERQELKLLIEELTLLVKKQKERLKEFLELNDKQARMLVAQEAVIASHNEQVTLIEMENQIIKRKYNDLERDIKAKKDRACSPLKKQLEQYRQTVAEDKDSLKIKEKIIEDQATTIIDLRKKIQANSGVTMNIMNQGLSQQQESKKARLDSDEKIRKLEYENSLLRENLQEMRERKTKLQAQIAAIDTHLIRDYRSQADQIERQKEVIVDLRGQMSLLTEEHQLQMNVLMKDLNSAKMTARYATQKLEETLRDFQKQTNSQMQVRDVLTGMLREKDGKLKNAIVKMSSLTFDPTSIASAISRQKPPAHLQELNHFLNSSNFDTFEATTKIVTKHIVEDASASDFQQLCHLVPSELYSNVSWDKKKVKALRERNCDDNEGETEKVKISCYKTEGCFPPEDVYCSGQSGTSSGSGTFSGCNSSGTTSSGEKDCKEGSKNIFISPYVADEPTYIYVPKFRPNSPVSPFEPPQAFVPKQSNESPACNISTPEKADNC